MCEVKHIEKCYDVLSLRFATSSDCTPNTYFSLLRSFQPIVCQGDFTFSTPPPLIVPFSLHQSQRRCSWMTLRNLARYHVNSTDNGRD